MSEISFLIYLDEAQENRYRHWHMWYRGEVTEFMIQYEAFIDGRWHPVLRHDSAHGQAHRDLLHPDGAQSKEMYPDYSYAEIMTIGQRDIIENWLTYRTDYVKEIER